MNRRTLLLAAAAAPFAPPALAQGARGRVFVLNSRDANVSVLDAATGAETARIPTLREPHHLVYTPDRRAILLGDSAGNELMMLDPATATVTRRIRISNPYHLLFSPDAKLLTVASLARDQVDVYDAASFELRHRLKLPDMPSHIAWSADSRVSYVTLQANNRLAAVDATTGALLWTVPTGKTPAGVVMRPEGRLLVANMGEDTVTVHDPRDGKLIQTIRTGAGAHNIFPAPDGLTLYVTNRVAATITALDPRSLAPVRTYRAPGAPDCLDFSADARQMWFSQRVASRVGVIDIETGAVVANHQVGRSPHGILFHAMG